MANVCFLSVAPELAALDTKIDTIDTVVDAIRAVDVPALTAAMAAISTRGQTKFAHFTTASTSYVTALTVSGKGKLLAILYSAETNSTNPSIKFTVDGEVFGDIVMLDGVWDTRTLYLKVGNAATVGAEGSIPTENVSGVYCNLMMEFISTLLVEVKVQADSIRVFVIYVEDA